MMKKNGFTLAELIVTLGIIGLVVAITAPLIGGIMPDRNKVQVLKVYKTLSDITSEIIDDKSLYMNKQDADNECKGLECTDSPLNPKYSDNLYTGVNKFSYLLASKLELDGNPTLENTTLTFTTIDGIAWESTPDLTNNKLNYYRITVDLDENGTNSVFDEASKPDRFEFKVDTNGRIQGIDSLTQAYLLNPNKLNNKKKDYTKAENIKNTKKPKPSTPTGSLRPFIPLIP